MHELGRRYGLNLLAQGGDGEVVDARQQAPVAPLEVLREVARKWPRRMAPVASRRKSEASMAAGEMREGLAFWIIVSEAEVTGSAMVAQNLGRIGR